MDKDNMLEYDFIDKYTKSLATNMPLDTSEVIYTLEVKKQEKVFAALFALALMGIIFLAVITYWL